MMKTPQDDDDGVDGVVVVREVPIGDPRDHLLGALDDDLLERHLRGRRGGFVCADAMVR